MKLVASKTPEPRLYSRRNRAKPHMLARKLEKYLIFAADILSINLSFAFLFWLRFKSGFLPEYVDASRNFATYTQIAFITSLVWIAYFYLSGLYRDWYLESRFFQIYVVTKKITVGVVVILLMTSGPAFFQSLREWDWRNLFTYSRIVCSISYWLVFVATVNGFRMAVQSFMRQLLRKQIGMDSVLILGANKSGLELMKSIKKTPSLGWKVIGFVDEAASRLGTNYGGLPILGKYSDLPDILENNHVGGIIISHESASHNQILRILAYVAEYPLSIFLVPDLYDAVSGHFKTSAVHGMPLKVLFPEHMPAWEAHIKRVFDIVFSAVFLLFATPVLLLVSILIKLDSRGPVFYSQERIGQYGKRFRIWKFRTMRQDAEAMGPQWASQKDPRVTRLGRILRKTRIDEIPQLICVLSGDMSLVGPRPEREHFIRTLKHEVPLYLRRLKMKPGLTGWAQVKHKYDSNLEDVKTKIMYDLYYFENMSLALDFQILFRTVWVVISGHGAH